MRNYLCLAILMLFSNLVLGFGLVSRCTDKKYTLTEVLANADDKHHIFTCKLLATYLSPVGYTSMAVVENSYRGSPADTVYIETGGLPIYNSGTRRTTANSYKAFGRKLPSDTEWLIISESKDNYHYTATICYNLSRRIDVNSKHSGNKYIRAEGNKYLELVKQFFCLTAENYTGRVELIVNNQIWAEGDFENGKATCRWKHNRVNGSKNRPVVLSEIDYEGGHINGYVFRYDYSSNIRKLSYESYTIDSLLQWEVRNQQEIKTYTYKSNNLRLTNIVTLNDALDTVRVLNAKRFDFLSRNHPLLSSMDGYYFNIKKSRSYKTLCKGHYFHGAKIGQWEYFDKSGKVIRTEYFDHPDTLSTKDALVYKANGIVLYKGRLVNGRKVGLMQEYSDGVLSRDYHYNSSANLELVISYSKSNGRSIAPFKNGKLHGKMIGFYASGKLRFSSDFSEGVAIGHHIKYDTMGIVIEESVYKNGRKTTINSTSDKAPFINGFSNGYNIRYSNPKGGFKMFEGEMWMGYPIGEHIHYAKDGSYSITYYKQDKDRLAHTNMDEWMASVEFYDKNDKLIEAK